MLVEWKESALDRLADIWVTVPKAAREHLERTIDRINARLAEGPAFLGESRATEFRRVWFEHPFVIGFDYSPGQPSVYVTHVVLLRPWTANE